VGASACSSSPDGGANPSAGAAGSATTGGSTPTSGASSVGAGAGGQATGGAQTAAGSGGAQTAGLGSTLGGNAGAAGQNVGGVDSGGASAAGTSGSAGQGGSGGAASGGAGGSGGSSGEPRSPGCGKSPPTAPSKSQQQTLQILGDPRYYLMDVPAGVDNETPLVLVLALHGYDMNNIAVVNLFNFTQRSAGKAITVWPKVKAPTPAMSPIGEIRC